MFIHSADYYRITAGLLRFAAALCVYSKNILESCEPVSPELGRPHDAISLYYNFQGCHSYC